MGSGDEWPCGAVTLGVPSRGLVLRPASDVDAVAMGRIVHDLLPDHERHFTPGLSSRLGATSEETAESFRARTAENREGMAADHWSVPFAVVVDGRVVGMQSVLADDFPEARSVRSGSFLDTSVRGQGIGTVVRALVVEFCVTLLGAREMLTGHMTANHASRRVSERLGYAPIATEPQQFAGTVYTKHLLRLSADDWRTRRHEPVVPGVSVGDFVIDGPTSWPGVHSG
jgi:RimJ/RimL family protein N-acetyltransferase